MFDLIVIFVVDMLITSVVKYSLPRFDVGTNEQPITGTWLTPPTPGNRGWMPHYWDLTDPANTR